MKIKFKRKKSSVKKNDNKSAFFQVHYIQKNL